MSASEPSSVRAPQDLGPGIPRRWNRTPRARQTIDAASARRRLPPTRPGPGPLVCAIHSLFRHSYSDRDRGRVSTKRSFIRQMQSPTQRRFRSSYLDRIIPNINNYVNSIQEFLEVCLRLTFYRFFTYRYIHFQVQGVPFLMFLGCLCQY